MSSQKCGLAPSHRGPPPSGRPLHLHARTRAHAHARALARAHRPGLPAGEAGEAEARAPVTDRGVRPGEKAGEGEDEGRRGSQLHRCKAAPKSHHLIPAKNPCLKRSPAFQRVTWCLGFLHNRRTEGGF